MAENGLIELVKTENLESEYSNSLAQVEEIVLKNYITNLTNLEIENLDLDTKALEKEREKIRLIKIDEMVYSKNENITHKFASVFSSIINSGSSLVLIIKHEKAKTNFYMGIKSEHDMPGTTQEILNNSFIGQFPGTKFTNKYDVEIEELLKNIKSDSISIVSGLANSKTENFIENEKFLQGLEKLSLDIKDEEYTAVIIANPISQEEVNNIKNAYENIYTQLSPFSNFVISEGINNSISKTRTETEGKTETKGTTKTEGITKTDGESNSVGLGLGIPSKKSLVGVSVSKSFNHSKSVSNSESKTYSLGISNSISDSLGSTEGSSKSLQLTAQNKTIQNILKKLDKQLERIDECESIGMWKTAAYFFSETLSTSKIVASTYKSLIIGENTGLEKSAINTWLNKEEKGANELIAKYISILKHPIFKVSNEISVDPTAMMSSNELAIQMGLPRKSVPGFPVIEHADFGKEAISYSNYNSKNSSERIKIGNVFNMGAESKNKIELDIQSLSMHTFVTGATGSGKSNTLYKILEELDKKGIKFLVIEPAKGEYKNVFGNEKDVNVYGTNPEYTKLLKINPFKFPEKIHVLEHIDRLIDIFNVCWPMYAAMPAFLKEAIENTYEKLGWDLINSKNKFSSSLFPIFTDLLESLREIIDNSDYSKEAKDNYTGSLITRVKSLTNGLNKIIFCADEIDNEKLFDENTIIDLSRVGSNETKSFIMGLLTMRLQEHRMSSSEGMNQKLKHITVLEEAHNLLKRTSTEQSSETSNLLGKSVEMIANAIAEMRTYGEGFIIVDQAPGLLDMSVIRNTNTKIIMNLPDLSDRELVGKAVGLSENQITEIAKLPTGVGVIYQNKWVEAILGKIEKFETDKNVYSFTRNENEKEDKLKLKQELLKLLLLYRVEEEIKLDVKYIEENIEKSEFSSRNKIKFIELLKEYKKNNKLEIWKTKNFEELSELVVKIVDDKKFKIKETMEKISNYSEFHKEMLNFIEKEIKIDNIKFKIEVLQNILKNFSLESEDHLEIYSAWREKVKKGVI